MRYLAGEWPVANILFGLVFIVASSGVVGLSWYVLRGDRLNRAPGAGSDHERTEPAGLGDHPR